MAKTDARKINKKIEELWKESEKGNPQSFNTERSYLDEFTPQEIAELETALGGIFQRKDEEEAKQPKKRWTWKFYGLYLFKFAIWLTEILIVSCITCFLLPIAINTNVTIFQSLSLITLLAVIKKWMK
jgi:hypothetical protein